MQARRTSSQLLDAQTTIVLAEAAGGSWLQRNWRPITNQRESGGNLTASGIRSISPVRRQGPVISSVDVHALASVGHHEGNDAGPHDGTGNPRVLGRNHVDRAIECV